jgi:hypothetical protein
MRLRIENVGIMKNYEFRIKKAPSHLLGKWNLSFGFLGVQKAYA